MFKLKSIHAGLFKVKNGNAICHGFRFSVLILTFASLIPSCAHKKSDNKLIKVSNKDFDFKTEIIYKRGEDKFENKLNLQDDVLIDESLARLELNELYKLDIEKEPSLQATSFCHMKKSGNAFNQTDKMYKEFKGQPIYWNIIGVCYLLENDFRKAKLFFNLANDFYQKAQRSKTPYGPALHNIGVIYVLNGDYEKGAAVFREVLKIAPNSKTTVFNLIQTYLKFGIFDQAKNLLDYLYKLNKTDPDVVNGYAQLYYGKGQYKRALGYFNQLLPKTWKRPWVGMNYALALTQENDFKKAYKVFSEVKIPSNKEDKNYYDKIDVIVRTNWNKLKNNQDIKNAK